MYSMFNFYVVVCYLDLGLKLLLIHMVVDHRVRSVTVLTVISLPLFDFFDFLSNMHGNCEMSSKQDLPKHPQHRGRVRIY